MDINRPIADVRNASPDLAGIDRLVWAVAGLAEEATEVLGLMNRLHWKKNRKGKTEEDYIDELGDVLWYLAQVCAIKGLSLEQVWNHNQAKLTERWGTDQKNV